MIKLLLRSLGSMLRSPQRLAGRSWRSELVFRTLRSLFCAGNENGLAWFRAQTSKPIAHPDIKKVSRSQRVFGGVDCLVVEPQNGEQNSVVIVYLHGGGYVVGSPMGHLSLIAPLAIEAGCQVIAPDYRLAPEHPLPTPQDDCVAAILAIQASYPDSKLVLAGDSAGGALAIASQLNLQSNGHTSADGLMLISPWVDPLADSGSIITNASHDYLEKRFLDDSIEALMQGPAADTNWHDPRINFTQVDVSQLPPTLVQYGGGEVFADQVAAFCVRAKQQGVALEEHAYDAQFHVFQLFSGLLKDAKHALQSMGEFTKKM